MIEKIVLENFKSHKHTELELSPGINVISGVSLSGKSNIFRGINWVRTNRPSGFDFRNKYSSSPRVTVTIKTNSHTITLTKTKSTSKYIVDDCVYEKTGKSVPDQVHETLRLNDINIQQQLDEPFLINSPTSQISKFINRFIGMEKVDEWVSQLTKKINSAGSTLEEMKRDIRSIERNLKKYDGLDELSAIQKEYDKKLEKYNRSVKWWNDYWVFVEQVKNERILKRLRGDVKDIEDIFVEIKLNKQLLSLLQGHSAILTRTKKQKANLSRQKSIIKQAESVLSTIATLRTERDLLLRYTQVCLKYEEAVSNIKSEIEGYIKTVEKAKICPVCKSKINTKCISRLRKEIEREISLHG